MKLFCISCVNEMIRKDMDVFMCSFCGTAVRVWTKKEDKDE